MPANLENLSRGHKTGNSQFSFNPKVSQFSFIQSQRRVMPKNVQPTTQWQSFHMLAKECSKFSKLGFDILPFKLDLEKEKEQNSKRPHSVGTYTNIF